VKEWESSIGAVCFTKKNAGEQDARCSGVRLLICAATSDQVLYGMLAVVASPLSQVDISAMGYR